MFVFSIWHWVVVGYLIALALLLVAWPVARILRRTGMTRWWTWLIFIPPLNLVLLWIIAYRHWPAIDAMPGARGAEQLPRRSNLVLDPFGVIRKRRR